MAEVEVREVSKAFDGGRTVLDRVGFAAADGEFVSLLGASGCGKTTLLRIVAGLESADSGEVRIGGRDVSGVGPKDRDVAMVFQSYALYPHLPVSDNIAMGLKLRGFSASECGARVAEAARMLDLTELLERRPAALSGGQRQRVALARALVRRPKVFLLDEPLSNLDAVLRDRTRGELKLLFERLKGTVLYVTHDQIEAMTLSDRIVLLDGGRIQQAGTPQEIYRRPANTFVASFLGSPPMSLFAAEEALRRGWLGGPPPPEGALCGIRPEEVEVSRQPREGFSKAEVALAEPTGASTILTLDAGLGLKASVPGTWEGREAAWVRLPRESLHFFDGKTRARLSF